MTAAGLRPVEHPLLPAAVALPDGSLVLTGRLPGAGSGGWLAEHVVAGTALLPGAGLVEWALQAAYEAGCGGVEELALQVPLTLPASGALRVRVMVGAPGDDGRRTVEVHSRPDHDQDSDTSDGWVCHAEGVLAPTADDAPADPTAGAWPPPEAEPVDVTGFYDRAATAGYGYGPTFRGLTAAWRHGDDLLAEITLPEDAGQDADTFGIHPALLDAALHPAMLDGGPAAGPDGEQLWLPFAWSGVSLWATGARRVRVRMTRQDEGLRIALTDDTGAPVLNVDSVAMRPISAAQLRTTGGQTADGLLVMDWVTAARGTSAPAGSVPQDGGWAELGDNGPRLTGVERHPDLDALLAAADGGAPMPAVVLHGVPVSAAGDRPETGLAVVAEVLALVQRWLAEPRLLDARLVVVTRGAVPVSKDDVPTADPAGAGVWGLVRSVQAEHPDRFTLVDVEAADSTPDGPIVAAVALAADEPQLAVRHAEVLVPRLVRAAAGSDAAEPDLTTGTVVVSGGTGVLGGVVAEHLVRAYGVRRLLLLSRSGLQAAGAVELVERLAELGASAEVAAVDVADHDALATVLAAVPADHPVVGVLHAAGVVDDGLVETWDADRLARVWGPKAAGAWNLHRLTADLPVRMFTVFSSAAGMIGNPGQAGYAAANAWTDALTTHRRTQGLPGISIAWSLWEQTSAMTQHLSTADLARLNNLGMRPLTTPHALHLLDTATRLDQPLTLAADLDPTQSATNNNGATIPPILRALTRPGRRRAAAQHTNGSAFTARLAGLDTTGRHDLLLQTVRTTAATVLGHHTPHAIAPSPLQRTRLRLTDRRRTAQPPHHHHRTTPARHPDLRPPHPPHTRHLPPTTSPAPPPRHISATKAPPGQVPYSRRSSRGRGDGLPLPRRRRHPRRAVATRRQRHRRREPVPHRPRLGPRQTLPPRPRPPRHHLPATAASSTTPPSSTPAFFGISPREALAIDPQQRLLLEHRLGTPRTRRHRPRHPPGHQHRRLHRRCTTTTATGLPPPTPGLEGYGLLTGITQRHLRTHRLHPRPQGPAITIDTACSSSLVALHLAAQALRTGECDLALAGGVTVMSTPDIFTEFSRQRGLSPDGRCKAFSAARRRHRLGRRRRHSSSSNASPTPDATATPILAVIRGSAVNQDGASNGLTAPNGPSQQRVIQQALANAGLTTTDIDAVEAHGTGTTLGDPIEAQALLATYGTHRTRRPTPLARLAQIQHRPHPGRRRRQPASSK